MSDYFLLIPKVDWPWIISKADWPFLCSLSLSLSLIPLCVNNVKVSNGVQILMLHSFHCLSFSDGQIRPFGAPAEALHAARTGAGHGRERSGKNEETGQYITTRVEIDATVPRC